MHTQVGYDQSASQGSSITIPATLTVTETDLYKFSYGGAMQKSQFSIFGRVTLGAVASVTFYYYFSPDNGTTWFPVGLYNTGTGEMTRRAVLLDSGSYSTGGDTFFVDDIPVSGANAFKVTGKSASGTPTLVSLAVQHRDN